MNGSNKLIRIIASCMLVYPGSYLIGQQNEKWIDVAEELLNRESDSRHAEEHCEELQILLSYPININSASLAQLESCGLFTPYQAQQITLYREKYGKLLSLYELASLPGFRRALLEEQAIYMTVDESKADFPMRQTTSMLLFYAGMNFPDAGDQAIYPGSSWKTSLRIKKAIGARFTVGMAYEKDQGEKAFWEQGPEHICGFLEWRGRRRVEQLMLGNFRINNGLGLIQGSGLMHSPQGLFSRPLLLSTLKPYAGVAESLIHRGAACKLNLGYIKLVLWTSFQNIDLSLGDLSPEGRSTDWADHIRESGYHRTPTEPSGRKLGYIGSAGIQALACLGSLNLGIQYSPEINGLNRKGRDSLQYFYEPVLYHASSLQWLWRHNKVELFGEFAPGSKKTSALLAGSRFHINDFLSGLVQIHWYEALRRETFSSAYASGSHVKNERGVLLVIHTEPFREFRAETALEFFSYPAPRSLVNVPSSGFRFSLNVQNGSRGKLVWRLRMVNTSRQHSKAFDHPGIRPLISMQNLRIDGRITYMPVPWFTWQSRLDISFTPGKAEGVGHTALQQLTVRIKERIKCTTRLVLYNVPSWDNRIYLHEPGLYQQFKFPVYSGTGNKISILTSLKATKRINLEARASLDRERERKRWEAEMQLRLKL